MIVTVLLVCPDRPPDVSVCLFGCLSMFLLGAHRVHSVPGAHRVRSIPGAHRVRSVPGAHRFRSDPGAHRVHSRNLSSQVVVICSIPVASYSAGPTLASCSAYSSGPTSTPRAWPTIPTPDLPPAHPPRHFSVLVCGAPVILSFGGGGGVVSRS